MKQAVKVYRLDGEIALGLTRARLSVTTSPCPSETDEAKAFHRWLELNKIDHTHIGNESNGGTRAAMIRGAKLKAMGQSRGFPDYLIFPTAKSGRRICLAVELKRRYGGRTSPEQKRWLNILSDAGFLTGVCKGAIQAMEFVTKQIERY